MSQQQRMQIDAITAHIASTASSAAHHVSQSYEGTCNQAGAAAVQLAALKALLASMLSPAPHRPPFLPQALALFTQVTFLGHMFTDRLRVYMATVPNYVQQHDHHSVVCFEDACPKVHTQAARLTSISQEHVWSVFASAMLS